MFLESLLYSNFLTFALVLTRVSGMIVIAPIFSHQAIPMRVRALLAVTLSLLLLPMFWSTAAPQPVNLLDLVIHLGCEMLVGLVLGVGLMILFSGIQVAGQIIGQLSGMALADSFDPTFNSNSPIFTPILAQVTIAVFLLIGGHREMMAALLDTFHALPPGLGANSPMVEQFAAGPAGYASSVVHSLTTLVTESFVLGIRAAAPVMTALLLTTILVGLISRTLPQLNILAFGFGLNALITLGGLMLSLGGVAWVFQEHFATALEVLAEGLGIGG